MEKSQNSSTNQQGLSELRTNDGSCFIAFNGDPISEQDLTLINHKLPHYGEGFQKKFQNLYQEQFKCSNKINRVMEDVFKALRLKIERYLDSDRRFKGMYRLWVGITVEYSKVTDPEYSHIGNLQSSAYDINYLSNRNDMFCQLFVSLAEKNARYIRESSGLVIRKIEKVQTSFAKYNPIQLSSASGKSFIKLPKFLQNKNAIVNVQNTDEQCFGYAVMAALTHNPKIKQHTNAQRPSKYMCLFNNYKLDQIQYPVDPFKVGELEQIEKDIQININVFSFYDDEGKARHPLYISKTNFERSVDLLYYTDANEDNAHYAAITDFSRFMHDVTKHEHKKIFCKMCFSHFSEENHLFEHSRLCAAEDRSSVIYDFPKPGTDEPFCYFKNERDTQRLPFIIYADFEAFTIPFNEDGLETDENHSTIRYQQHDPHMISFVLVSTVSEVNNITYMFIGEDCVQQFLKALIEVELLIKKYLFEDKPMIMSEDDVKDFSQSNVCYICKQKLTITQKVRNHDHFTGKYRGCACNRCNFLARKQYKIPVFFHNFRHYYGHFLIRHLHLTEANIEKSQILSNLTDSNSSIVEIDPNNSKYREINVIAQGMEKYLIISWGDHIVFKDSVQFLLSSLEDLVETLLKSGEDRFKVTKRLFNNHPNLTDLLRKGVFPYDYFNHKDKLSEKQLPSRDKFFNRLRDKEISEEDYQYAQRIFQIFGCKTLGDYAKLYLTTDVGELADVFENFRDMSLEKYGLDPAHYVSAPHLSWDALLLEIKQLSGLKIELITDRAMFDIIDAGMRGGIAMISKRYAKANNPYIGAAYNPNEPIVYISYQDRNNLYGEAEMQYLPHGDFKWMTEVECDISDPESLNWILTLPEDSPVGCILVVDLEYPEHLHELHNDYPLAPEKLVITKEMMGPRQHQLMKAYNHKPPEFDTKLVPNLMNKRKYVTHYRNLQFYIEHGLVLTKIQCGFKFHQSPWMSSYVIKNTYIRKQARNEAETNFPKLMNNAVYGKTCENVKKRSDIRLYLDEKVLKQIRKPHCVQFRNFDDKIVAVEMGKIKALINKPIYVGFAILELSKHFMFRYHHDVIKKTFGNKAELLMTDTD